MSKKLDPALLLAFLLPIFAVAPFVQNAGIPNVADGVIHLLRQVDFDRAFRSGALVPRWGADLYLGFGYPLYNFAPPLLAYLVEAFHLAGMAMDDALKLVVVLTLELYSVGMFLFMRPKVGELGALAAAALNVYAPVRMREALVTGGNYPQFLAMALFPLILWAFDGVIGTSQATVIASGAKQSPHGEEIASAHTARLAMTQRRFVAVAALSVAALILSHLFHALIFTPVATGHVLLRLLMTRATRGVWTRVVVAAVLGVMLAAFFWLPTIAERSLTRTAAEAYVASSDYHQRFLSWYRLLAPPLPLDPAEANADVPLALGWAQIAVGALGLTIAARHAIGPIRCPKPDRSRMAEPIFFAAVLAISIFLQLPSSAFVWENVALLPVAEFPWRFMGISSFALAVLGGYVSHPSPPRYKEHRVNNFEKLCALGVSVVSVFFVLATIVTAFPYLAAPHGFARLGTPTVETVRDYELSTGAFGLTTINEYLPQTVQVLPADMPAPLSQPKIDLPAAAIVSAQWSPRGERDVVTLAQVTSVRFRIFNYPGWTVYVDGMAAPTTTRHDGTFTVPVPAGEHRVETRFEETAMRLVANSLSLMALFAFGGMGVWAYGRRNSASPRATTSQHIDISTPSYSHTPIRVVTVAIMVLLLAKILVLDAQGWLRTTRDTQPLATFENQIELLGAESDETTIARGGELHARFFWRPTQPLSKNYHVIAQLFSADGRAVAGSDKQHPGDPVVQGETPTTQIAVGTYLRDEHRIVIPATTDAGRYELRVGLYDSQTGKRLRLPSGETLFVVGVIEVR